MISKILIANRGEIALRVIKTCNKLGIKTVTIYSQDDARLPHAFESDESYNLGSGPLSSTYLNQERIIEIAKETGAEAIHPGYGFLSENAEFCKKIADAGLIFIGPSVEAINLMGDKKESKVKMGEIGIPLIKGYHGDNQEPALLKEEAKKIGYPVLIKATAGGGGKGMRIVNSENEFMDALAASKREAMNAFSDDKVLIEKYIINPRHIEVQLVSDGKNNHFHFFERECSIQRRYQKIIEESPSPALSDQLRADICETAVKISSGIDYVGAGTIEFILTSENEFYFLEMNTRLQVEHPVTEMVTGYDLVELQIEAAKGEAFDFKQTDIEQTGHSIECRVYAEDPDNDFLPTAGRIQKIQADASIDFRLDCGYIDGNTISTNFDPMLAKVIVHDFDRISAIEKMQMTLDDILFGGAKTNRDFLKRVLDNEQFINGDIHTHFIEEQKDHLAYTSFTEEVIASIIAGSLILDTKELRNIWDTKFKRAKKTIILNCNEHEIEIEKLNRNETRFTFNHKVYSYTTLYWSPSNVIIESDGQIFKINSFVFNTSGLRQIFVNEHEALIEVLGKAKKSSSKTKISEGSLQSPMPGKVFKVLHKVGSTVNAGEAVLIVEAMKMEHTVKATKDGIIKEIFFKEGDQVQGGVLLCEIE
jgi:3-methylcrotonyl-CoA carboxylase alpha subunit